MSIPLTDTFGFTPNKPNIDKRYLANNGQPYTSVSAAETALASRLVASCVGLTVLVADENDPDYPEAKEYWVQPYDNNGVTAYHLVEKQPQIDTSGFATKQEVNAKQDALPSGTTGQVLKKTANSVEWDDMPSIEDGENTAVTLEGAIHVSAEDAETDENAGVEIKPHTGTGGGVDMKFTLPKGADGITPEIDSTTKKWKIGNTLTDVLAEGHNHNRGTFNIADTLPSDGIAGDYIVVIDDTQSTTTAEIYKWDTTLNSGAGDWNPTGVAPNDAEFEDGQLVVNTKIDNTQLANPAANALPKATDVMPLTVKLEGVTASIEKANGYSAVSGKKVTADGTVDDSSSASYATINLNNAKKVRFAGLNLLASSGDNTKNTGYCFGHYNDSEEIESNWVIDEYYAYDATAVGSAPELVDIVKEVPQNATHLRTNVTYGSTLVDGTFFCYLINGERVVDIIPEVVDNLFIDDATKALSAKQGNDIFKNLSEIVLVDFADYNKIYQYIKSSNEWSNASTGDPNYGSYIIPLPIAANTIYIKAKNDINAQYAFLTSNSHNAGDEIDTVEGDAGGRKTLTKGTEEILSIPNGAKYLYITYSTQPDDVASHNGRLPEKLQFITPYAKINKVETTNSFVYFEIRPVELEQSISSSNGNWISNSGSSPLYHYQIPVCGGEHFHITPSATSSLLRYAFLSEIGTTAPTYSSGGLVSINLTTEGNRVPIDIIIPDGTKFLYIQAGVSAPSCIQIGLNATIARDWDNMMNKDTNLAMIDWPPITTMSFSEETSKALGILEETVSPNNNFLTTLVQLKEALDGSITNSRNDVTKSLQVLNALKKADQLRLISFTPKNNIPAKNTNLSTGTSRKSIPYSSNNDDLKLVGIQVSLHTFMTAINNPYSLMYTENCDVENSKSAWGKVYESNNAWSYYGTVCCGLTSSVYGCEYKIHNSVIGRPYRDFGNYIPLAPEGEVNWNNLKVGDIGNRYTSVHSFMIYEIQRDENNEIINVKIIESSSTVAQSSTGNGSGGVRISSYTKSNFANHIKSYPHTLYRYAKAYKNTDYEQSPFVTLADYGEVAGDSFVYNDEICTFAGDKASFAKGDLVVLNYNLDDNHPATTIKVYKDDVLIATKTVEQANTTYSDYASLSANGFNVIDQTNHVLVLGTELLPGKYKACIDDSENYTYWEVLDTDVIIAKVDDDTYKLFFNEEPSVVYLPCFNEHGSLRTYAIKEADMYDKRDKSMIIHPKSQYTLSMYSTYPYEGKIRVAVKGEYGIATGAVVELEPTEE